MSTALAVAGVTAVLRGMLESWLAVQNVNAALDGENASVTAVAPDIINLADDSPRLNLFLHQVSPNSGWRNVALPSRDPRGQSATRPPLALDLHYLLTAYGRIDLHAEVLLGYGMQLLHEVPALGREEIEDRLPGPLLPSQLGRQVEMIKITPQPMTTEESSKLWSALQAHYRPSAAYHVSVVLIESTAAARSPLPVLTRGPRDPLTNRERGIEATPDLLGSLPIIAVVRLPNLQPGAVLGDTVAIEGHRLDGSARGVHLESRQHGIDVQLNAVAGNEAEAMRFALPNVAAQLAVGTYFLSALVRRPGEAQRRESNRFSFDVLPHVTTPFPIAVATDPQGTATVNLTCRPEVRPHQRAVLVVGGVETLSEPHPASTSNLQFVIPDAPLGTHFLRLRVDGLESLLVDRTVTPPVFLNRRITIT